MPKEKRRRRKKRWRRIFEKAEEGDEDWLKENEPNVAFKHMATFRSHKKAKKEPLNYVEKRRTSGGATTRDKARS